MRKVKKRVRKLKRSTIYKRWKAKTPIFFKKVIKVGLGVGAFGGAVLASPVALPAFLITIAPSLVTAGAVSALIAKFTVEDNKDLNR